MVKTKLSGFAVTVGALALSMGFASAQTGTGSTNSAVPGLQPSDLTVKGPGNPNGGGQVLIPGSSMKKASDFGLNARTHYRIFVPSAADSTPGITPQVVQPAVVGPPYSGYYIETPASLACIYKLVTPDANYWCDPNSVTTVATGGSKVIAIVDAYHNASVTSDLAVFSAQFGLPAPTASNFQVVYASGSQPAGNTGWAVEIALDVEWAHAMAPNAKIVLVEAASNSFGDLLTAVSVASQIVQTAGGGEVSMSWGGSEFSGETGYDSYFQSSGVVYFASTGDDPGTEWPSVSPNIVAVGGTSTARAQAVPANKGHFRTESGWAEAGAGYSQYYARPAFQNSLATRLGPNAARVVPDVSADANPSTGVWIYCTTGCGNSSGISFPNSGSAWTVVGGTSLAAPIMAAMVNNAGHFRASSAAQLAFMYGQIGTSNFFDVDRSYCGPYAGFYATSPTVDFPGNPSYQFDPCTGLGAPRGLGGL